MKMNLSLVQGTTFFKQFRWEAEPFIYKPISQVDNSAPCVLHVTDHGLLSDQQFVVQAAKGMEGLNAVEPDHVLSDWRRATIRDKDTIELNRINTITAKVHTPNTGNIKYRSVVDLTGYNARMSITDKGRTTVYHNLSTALGSIVLDLVTRYIELTIEADTIAAFEWTKAIYDLELVAPSGRVFKVVSGDVTVGKEATKIV